MRGWNSLPHHLWHVVFEKAMETGGNAVLDSMRLVSKTLHAAVREYPTSFKIHTIRQCEELQNLRNNLPNLTNLSLELSSPIAADELQHLSASSKFTELSIAYDDGSGAIYKLPRSFSYLPSSLGKLCLSNVKVAKDCLASLKFVELRDLSLSYGEDKDFMIWQMLQHLPAVKVYICLLLDPLSSQLLPQASQLILEAGNDCMLLCRSFI